MNILFFLTPKATVSYLYDFNTLRQGLEKMKFHGYTAIPVINKDGKYMGTVSEGDFLWKIIEAEDYNTKTGEQITISDILRDGQYPSVCVTATMNELLERAMEQNFVPVVDDLGSFMGIITRKAIIKHYFEKVKTASRENRYV